MSKRRFYGEEKSADSPAAIRAEYDRLDGLDLLALKGMARRCEMPGFEDIKNSKRELVDALMQWRFGDGWERAFI